MKKFPSLNLRGGDVAAQLMAFTDEVFKPALQDLKRELRDELIWEFNTALRMALAGGDRPFHRSSTCMSDDYDGTNGNTYVPVSDDDGFAGPDKDECEGSAVLLASYEDGHRRKLIEYESFSDGCTSDGIQEFGQPRREVFCSGLHRRYERVVSWARRVHGDSRFDACSLAVVVLNVVWMGVETDWCARHLGKSHTTEPILIDVINAFFCFVFLTELLVRVLAEGNEFFFGADWKWNMFDFLIVSIQVADEVMAFVLLTPGKGKSRRHHPNLLRCFRIARIARLGRVVRLMAYFSELRTIIASVSNNFQGLFWSFVTFIMIMYCMAIFFTEALLDVRVESTAHGRDLDAHLMERFGTLYSAVVTLWASISGGCEWQSLALALQYEVSPTCALVLVIYSGFCILGLMNVVTGTFVETAMANVKAEQDAHVAKNVLRLFQDVHHNGTITWQHFQEKLPSEEMHEFFKALNVDRADAKALFQLLDAHGSGQVSVASIMDSGMRLRGPARALDLAVLMYETQLENEFVRETFRELKEAISELAARVDALTTTRSSTVGRVQERHHRASAFSVSPNRRARGRLTVRTALATEILECERSNDYATQRRK